MTKDLKASLGSKRHLGDTVWMIKMSVFMEYFKQIQEHEES